jgi:hypothetical protein
MMIVNCSSTKGRVLPENYHGLKFTGQSVFHVTLGDTYRVHEMALFNGGLILLVVDDNRQPNWYPAELFDVQDGALPSNWIFAFRDGGDLGTQAVWGHERLVSDEALDDALADGDSDARVTFWREIMPGETEDGM